MLVRLSKWVVVLALTFSLGAHWAFLQSVAWVSMIVSYSRDASFVEAVGKTFDGNHPCCLCKAIKQGRSEEKKQEQQQVKPGSKLDLGIIANPVSFDFSRDNPQIPSTEFSFSSRSDEPPKPRPRSVAACDLI